ncbi:MAG: hypothetical protein MUF27_02655 [Acidobacteria bacterium]|jgi:hypothetical protein|nr:hypothetical protein [Acidobacteriota bacterium]
MDRGRRPGLRAALALALAAGLTVAAVAAPEGTAVSPGPEGSAAPVSRLDTPHPGRLVAIELRERGAAALREGRAEQAEPLFERAAAADPLAAASWIALAAARIERCDRDGARFAALAGARAAISAEEYAAAEEAGSRAAAVACRPASPGTGEATTRTEAQLAERPDDYRAWAEAAAARRARGDLLLAAFEEEQALALGGEPAIRRMKLAQDLEGAGLWRAALELLAAEPGDDARDRATALADRLAVRRAAAQRIAAQLSEAKGWSDPEALAGLEDLALAALAADPDATPEQVVERLAGLLGVTPPAVVGGGWGRAVLRRGWSAVPAPPAPGVAAPALLLRRFPGDTQLALCDPGRAWSPDPETAQRFARDQLLAGREPALEEPARPCDPGPAEARCERSRWTVSIGVEGKATVSVYRIAAAGDPAAREVWAVGLAGGAGCGAACARDAARAVEDQVAALEPAAAAPGNPADEPCGWPVPAAYLSERPHRERDEPWRRISIGDGLSIEIPPGVVAARVDRVFRDAAAGPKTVLWLRGSFEDQAGTAVRIGDSDFAGWVDLRPLAPTAGPLDAAAIAPPRTDPGARRLGGAGLGSARRAAGLDGEAATARFSGATFRGSWLVHRVRTGGRELEIVLPVAAGEKSLAPLWIAITARPSEAEPPPPPYDVARRYRVRLDRQAVSGSPADPREGMLVGDGIRFLVPRGYRATLSGASADGFPVTLRNDRGSLIVVVRLASRDALAARRAELERDWGPPLEPWAALRSTRDRTVESAPFAPAAGGAAPRCAATLVTAEGAFLLLLSPGNETDPAAWAAESELVTSSLKGR